jgi:hypothetical protein
VGQHLVQEVALWLLVLDLQDRTQVRWTLPEGPGSLRCGPPTPAMLSAPCHGSTL